MDDESPCNRKDSFALINNRGLFRSTDSGSSWEKLDEQQSGKRFHDMLINQNDDIFISTYTLGILRSTDDGYTWNLMSKGLEDVDVRRLSIGKDGHIFVSTYFDYVYRSVDNGANWVQSKNGLVPLVHVISADDSGNVFAGTSGGVYRSVDSVTPGVNSIKVPKIDLFTH